MRYRVRIYEESVSSESVEQEVYKEVYGQDFPDLDVSKLILFLNQKRRVLRRKEGKGE